MNSKMKWRIAAMPLAVLAVAVPAVGCDQLTQAQATVCCTEFKVGADLSAADWQIEGEGKAEFSAFMQATADFAGTATSVVNEVGAACQAIAVDLGAPMDRVTTTNQADRTTAWCDAAVAQIDAKLGGKLVVVAQAPSCSFNANVQAACEATCTAQASCSGTLGDIKARCEPGKLSGKCSGKCTGKCEGSANVAVTCKGVCEGTCEGKCAGNCSKTAGGGDCRGACDGSCDGECRGSCTLDASASGSCEADCTGECSVDFIAPKCKAELTPPSADCQGSANCDGACKASASARVECTEPSIEVQFTGASSAEINLAVASLKLNLPKIIVNFEGKGKYLVQNATALGDATADLVANADKLSARAGLCAIPAGQALRTAGENLGASFQASGKVLTAVGM
jgi:hypothetical protein